MEPEEVIEWSASKVKSVLKKNGLTFNVSNVSNFKSPQLKDNISSEPYLCPETNGSFAKQGKCVCLLINCVSCVLTGG